jgi:hypothetical protein
MSWSAPRDWSLVVSVRGHTGMVAFAVTYRGRLKLTRIFPLNVALKLSNRFLAGRDNPIH